MKQATGFEPGRDGLGATEAVDGGGIDTKRGGEDRKHIILFFRINLERYAVRLANGGADGR